MLVNRLGVLASISPENAPIRLIYDTTSVVHPFVYFIPLPVYLLD